MGEPSQPDGGLDLAMATEEEGSWSESSNQPQPPARTPSPPPMPVAGPSSPPTRTPLLTRIGSLKAKLARRPKSTATPPLSYASTSPTVPILSTPARTRTARSSTSQNNGPFPPRRPMPMSDRPVHAHQLDSVLPRVLEFRSKEPFWRGVGSFSSSQSPGLPPSSDASEQDHKSDHEQTVKKPPRKSLSTTTRPPLPLPLLPLEAGSPTPGGGKLTKARRPMSLSGPAGGASIKVGVAKVPASLGRGAGAEWAGALGNGVEEGPEKERGGVMRSLRRLSHSCKKGTGPGEDPGRPRIPSSTSTGPGSSVTTGSRVPSSSTVPSLHEWNGGRRPSGSAPKSASAIILSSSAAVPRECDPSGSMFTLPIGLGEESDERELTRQSLTVGFRSSTSRSEFASCYTTCYAARTELTIAVNAPFPPRADIKSQLLAAVPAEKQDILYDFPSRLYLVYVDLHFAYLEINLLICVDAIPSSPTTIHFLDRATKLDQTADSICAPKWAIARDLSVYTEGGAAVPGGKIQLHRGPPMVWSAPFGRDLTKEVYIQELDGSTGASLKPTVLNPAARVWTMVTRGGASVVYSNVIAAHGFAHELADSGEYSGAPTEGQTYEGKIFIIGGGIASFTNVATTFKGIIRTLKECKAQIQAHSVKIFVRRGGPNYQEGLKAMHLLGESLGVPIKVYGPETHIAEIVPLVLGVAKRAPQTKANVVQSVTPTTPGSPNDAV
ncbi:citrate synthase [Ceratobasidium sp. 394]|nr:citrate synthase [Ceratobasidium sp. 394]